MSEQMIMKTCRSCKQSKPLNEFYKNHTCKYGYDTRCKKCTLIYQKSYSKTESGKAVHCKAWRRYQAAGKHKVGNKRYENSEKGRATKKHYQQTEKYKDYQRLYRIAHPERHKISLTVSNAIRDGKLPRPGTLSCHYCGQKAEQYHHWHGYEPEHYLDVIPICHSCHVLIHAKMVI